MVQIAAQYATAILAVLISLFPIYWMVISSLKTSDELLRAVPHVQAHPDHLSIISFINGWNSYFWPKTVTQSEASRTIAMGVQRLKETYAGQYVSNFNEIMAGAVMAIIPIVLLFF